MKADVPGLPWSSNVYTEYIYKFDTLTSCKMSKKMRAHVIGLQAQLWSETVIDSKQMDYYLFPRLISFAERAWNTDTSEQNWKSFLETIKKRELGWLKELSISYRPMSK